ncbi:phosphopantetheine-binding protein [Streptomyces sp. DW26H14]|uniref:phosphopantetheine-binding protein n=1 Tax=Streptomyces sp. DW26H14 TaxID=3435395 RepID=UPI00403DE2BC
MNNAKTAEEIGETVLGVVSDVLGCPVAELREQPVLAAHDWDSLASLEALAQLESGFQVRLELREFHTARTVDDMTALVAKALEH